MVKPGKIVVYMGPMFSQKSTSLFLDLMREKYKRKKVIYFKVSLEVKEKTPMDISTHWGNALLKDRVENFPCFHIPQDYNLIEELGDEQVVAIDEYQFFDREYVHPQLRQMSSSGKKVLLAGLDMDYEGNIFDTMAYAAAEATEVYKKTAICHYSGDPATHSWKNGGDLNQRLETGAEDKYVPVSRQVFNQLWSERKMKNLVNR